MLQYLKVGILNQMNNGIDILTKLGLTRRNAETYIVILSLDQPTAKAIAEMLQIARSEVYRATNELQKLGLIKKIISNPTTFRATLIADSINILIEQINERHKDNCRQAKHFVKNYICQNEKPNREVQYVRIQGSRIEKIEYEKYLSELQTSSDLFAHWEGISHAADLHFEAYKRALKRKVKIRFITNVPKGEKMPKKLDMLRQIGALEIRHTVNVPSGGLDLLDGKYLHIINVPRGDFKKIEILRSNDITLLEFAKDYFELKWDSSTTPDWLDA